MGRWVQAAVLRCPLPACTQQSCSPPRGSPPCMQPPSRTFSPPKVLLPFNPCRPGQPLSRRPSRPRCPCTACSVAALLPPKCCSLVAPFLSLHLQARSLWRRHHASWQAPSLRLNHFRHYPCPGQAAVEKAAELAQAAKEALVASGHKAAELAAVAAEKTKQARRWGGGGVQGSRGRRGCRQEQGKRMLPTHVAGSLPVHASM